jgi:hypothetical protein
MSSGPFDALLFRDLSESAFHLMTKGFTGTLPEVEGIVYLAFL